MLFLKYKTVFGCQVWVLLKSISIVAKSIMGWKKFICSVFFLISDFFNQIDILRSEG